ncbi:CKLF-like MARVEL transmembrane domain-containing protein 6 [Tachysurus ichikawai]
MNTNGSIVLRDEHVVWDDLKLTRLLSFVAFILEEVVSSCTSCGALYFFEFVSCTAFLFTLLLLILLSTPLHQKVGISCWPKLVRIKQHVFTQRVEELGVYQVTWWSSGD